MTDLTDRTAIRPMLLFIVGPPAVGKMAVGHEIAQRTGLRLFHNHVSIEPVLRFFDFSTPAFNRLVGEFRRRIFEEVANSDLPGLIFTFVWAFDLHSEKEHLDEYAAPFRSSGGRVLYVELEATQQERLRRNETEFRLAEKPSKRNVDESRRRLIEHDERHRFNSTGEFFGRTDHVRINNTHLSPEAVADLVIARFELPAQ